MKSAGKVFLAIGALSVAGAFAAGHFAQYPPLPRREDGVKHLVCIGDSITYGSGVRARRNTDAWPAVLGRRLGKDWQVLNYGLSGRTLSSTGDMPYIREKFYPETFRCKADVYVIMLGTNDAKPYNWDAGEYRRELELFLKKYAALEGARVVVMKPPKAFVLAGAAEVQSDILDLHIAEELPMMDQVASRLGIETVDLYAFTAGHPEWFDDGVHPNAAGNEAIGSYLYKTLFPQE